ncbi:hypothetical protein H9Q70_010415 [Fusarium xylarioides]|nr:hypothetical protein H9Q70_010415 [Fusarium xylarioides]KAG5778924.1 hypothetical protein H9Q73_007398 [Fusarium xylarioides]
MSEYTSYFSRIWARYTTFRLWFLPSRWSGYRITIGLWFQATQSKPVVAERTATTEQIAVYRPLPTGHIRVLLVEPGSYDDLLLGNLQEVDLESDKDGPYTALSYVWGAPWDAHDGTSPLCVNGHFFNITKNLDKALRHLRSNSTVQKLWVDAICINQQDISERAEQVMLMTRIYSSAKLVHCWLGDSTPSSDVGMEIMSFLAGDLPFDNFPWSIGSKAINGGLQDILDRNYFERIWVVQEAAVARNVNLHVGAHSIQCNRQGNAEIFLARVKLLEISPNWRENVGNEVDMRPIRELLEQSISQMYKQAGLVKEPEILDAVHSMRFRKFTDARDSIYGVMGLVSPGQVAGFVVDYSESWEETYDRFYKYALRRALQDPKEKWVIANSSESRTSPDGNQLGWTSESEDLEDSE